MEEERVTAEDVRPPSTTTGVAGPVLRARAHAERALRGAWVTMLGPDALEYLGGLGLDWVGLDTQHGALRADRIADHVRALETAGLPALVRTSGSSREEIQFALDAGAQGVIVPTVQSAAQAEAIARACRFPPRGMRSTGPSRPSLRDGFTPASANEDVLCLPMIETATGLEQAAEIAAVEGVDGLFVGPYDLGLSLRPDAPDVVSDEVLTAVEEVFSIATAEGKLTGVFAGSRALARRWTSAHFLALDADISLLRAAVQAAVTDVVERPERQ
jgi:4-hydroxy-2-oxoheptanedioate aldolase